MSEGNTWVNVLVGAAITLGLSFTGFSPLLGGGVSGYLEASSPKRGAVVGALSGVIVTLPLLLIVMAGIGFFVAVPPTGLGGFEVALILVMIVPLFFLWFVALSAAGGYLGAYIRVER